MRMGFTTKSRMGFFLVLFPEEDHSSPQESNKKTQNSNLFSLSSPISLLKHTNSSNLFQKAQSTISICLLLLFTTLLLFTLSALPSSSTTAAAAGARLIYGLPRRHLSVKVNDLSFSTSNLSYALQEMGTLYRRGTKAMSELVVAHAVESLTLHEFKLFLRLFYRSGITSRSDLLFVFPSKTAAFDILIMQENDSFLKLVTQYRGKQSSNRSSSGKASFVKTHFVKLSEKEKESGEPIWGRRIGGNFSEEAETESTRTSYGSVVGFDADELDPENSLSGFLDHVPMSLRRWACYPMLLGRVKRNFKHIMLVDMKEMLVLGDQLGRVRSQSPESVLVTVVNQSAPGKHGKKNSDKTHSTRKKPVNPGMITGGSRGVRGLSNSMLMDIVRAALQQKKKNPVSESSLFNQLVRNEFVLKNVKMVVSPESVPELSSLVGSNSKSGSHLFTSNHTVIRRGNINLDVYSTIMKHICSFPLDSTVYSGC